MIVGKWFSLVNVFGLKLNKNKNIPACDITKTDLD